MIWFTSDSHFEHENIIQLSSRPFHAVQDMNEGLVSAWNDCVSPKDTVYHLGDFAFSHSGHRRWLPRLHGKKHLILGNHDPTKKLKNDPLEWKTIDHVLNVNFEKNIFFLSHYAHRVWPGSHRGSYMLYGHSHGDIENTPWGRSMDVGVDNIIKLKSSFRPISIDEVVEFLSNRELMNHHSNRA